MKKFLLIALWMILPVAAFGQSTTTNLTIPKPTVGAPDPQTRATIRSAFDQFDAAVAGRLSKSVAGSSDVTLTTTEARNKILELTGTLTGNINVIVPTKTRQYTIYNNTAGSFTLTVKTSGGSGVILSQGTRNIVYCDGTNVVSVVDGNSGGSGTVFPGNSGRLAYYPATASEVDDTPALTYSGSSPTLTITSLNSTYVPLQITLASGQSAAALEVKNNGGTTVSSLSASGGFGISGDSTISLTGTNTTFPRKLQLTNIGGGTAFRFELESEGTSLANREGGKFQLFARYGIKLVGTRNSTSAASFEAGSSSDPAVHVENGATGVIPLVANAISSTSVNTIEAQTNGTRVWAVRQSQAYGTHYSQGNVSGSVTFDFDNGNFISVTVTGNITSTTFSDHQAGGRYVLKFTQGGSGGYTWTPPTSFKYPGGVPGNMLSSAVGAVDVFVCDSDGTNLYCNGLFDVKNP